MKLAEMPNMARIQAVRRWYSNREAQRLTPGSAINVTVRDGAYLFDAVPYSSDADIAIGAGVYVFAGVPVEHPIGFYSDRILVTEGALRGNIDGVSFYSGRVTISVSPGFETASYGCLYHGFMGGEERLRFTSS